MEIRTSVTPTLNINLRAPQDPASARLLQEIAPVVTLYGPTGPVVLAPYGQGVAPEAGEWTTITKVGVGLLLGVVGIGILGKALL